MRLAVRARCSTHVLTSYASIRAMRRYSGTPTWAQSTPSLSTKGPVECALTGSSILNSPYFNKGSAFTAQEREDFEITSLLPSNVQTLDDQTQRAYQQYSWQPDDLSKNTFLASMKDQNETLYYALLLKHIKEMFGIVYTPTQGEAIMKYSSIFRRPYGCFLNINEPDRLEASLDQWGSASDVDLIVVTDGEAILGLGDQGVGGILISSAKLSLYTLCAGVHPHRVIPVVIDVGTNNERLLNDPRYLGLHQNRVRGERYDAYIERFVNAVREKFPKALLHFEDFGLINAAKILDKYRGTLAVFNDDIQGTGCTALAALTAATKIAQVPMKDLRVVLFGAGSAGCGIAGEISKAIALDGNVSLEEARKQFWCVDKPGLLLESMGDHLTSAQRPFAQKDEDWHNKPHGDLKSVVQAVKPHVLIGSSTRTGAFTEDLVKDMASHVERPIILPLSNPTSLAEADPKDLNEWTEGRALIATGSPFPAVEWKGKKYTVAECNNSTIYPAIGFGVILSRARLLTDKMLVSATKALAAQSPSLKDPQAGLLPDIEDVRELSVGIAAAVIRAAVEDGLNGETNIPTEEHDLDRWIRDQMWVPQYRPLKRVDIEEAGKHALGLAGARGQAPPSGALRM